MKKIVYIVILVGLVVAFTFMFYKSLERGVEKESNALLAIPHSAALIFESDEIGEIWRDLSQTNIIWEELKSTDFYFRLNEIGTQIDSMLVSQAQLRQFLSDKAAAVSVHVSGSKDYSYLLSVQLNDNASEADIRQGMKQLFGGNAQKQRVYDGVNYYTLTPNLFENEISFYVHKGLLVISLNELLIEESIRAIEQDATVLNDQVFNSVRETRGSNTRGQVYVNYKELKNIISQYAKSEFQNTSFFEQAYAEWSALDLDIKPDAFNLSGFVSSPDSSFAWLGAFKNLRNPSMYALEYMPANTAYFVFLGFGNFGQYKLQRDELIGATKRKYAYDKRVASYDDLCNCLISEYALDWIGSQAAFFITEPNSVDYEQNAFAVFESNNPDQARESLLQLEEQLVKGGNTSSETFRDIEIRRLQIGSYYKDILSEAFSLISDPYYAIIDDMVIMANSANALRSIINTISQSKTLDKDPEFVELSSFISNKAQFLLYNSLARSPNIYANILADPYKEELEKSTEVLRKFKAFVYQVGHYRDDLFFNNVYFEHSPEYKKETNALWELELKASLDFKPQLVRNHYTDALEIFVQDDENRIYLIGNTGKIIWERELDEKLLSTVRQVDLYKNRKLQLVFNTASKLYVLDRNGNNVEGFPITLSALSSAPMGIADYDRSRDYRFFVPLENGKIELFDSKGKPVKGWKFKDDQSQVVRAPEHFRIKSKDYIFTYNNNGRIYLLNRRGDNRHNVTATLEGTSNGEPSLEIRKSIEESSVIYVDSTGHLVEQKFNDRFNKVLLTNEEVLDYLIEDIDADGIPDCTILTGSNMTVYKSNGQQIFSVQTEGLASHLQSFQFSNNSVRIGYTDLEDNQLYLYTSKGVLVDGFPLYGSTAYSVGDLNRDGYFNLVTGSKDGFVFAYSISQ